MIANLISANDLCFVESALRENREVSLDRQFQNGPFVHIEVQHTGKSESVWGCTSIIRAFAKHRGGYSSSQNCRDISELRAFLGA